MYSLINDLSTLTTIPVSNLTELVKKSNFCICDDLEDSILAKKDSTDIDIGIGTLTIKVVNNNVKYRFTPSKQLESNVTSTIIDNKNPLTCEAENALVNRIMETYKDFL